MLDIIEKSLTIDSMSRKKKILLQTNAPWIKTGLGENGRYLMKHLLKTGKYDLVYYCTNGIFQHDPNLGRMPCKAYGVLPSDQNALQQIGQNQELARQVSYGSYFIDQIMKEEAPDIWWESDDLWSTNGYLEKPWFKHVSTIFHKTPDSVPILDVAYQQAKATQHYYTWVKYAADEMKRVDPTLSHVGHVYGMTDTSHFSPISATEKAELRRRFKIDQDCVIFHYMGRNQYRKSIPAMIEAFAMFKRAFPKANAKIHIHTAFGERAQGWDIPRIATQHGVKQEDVLCTYICKNCGAWHVAPYQGEDVDCPYCGAKKSMGTPTVGNGVPDEEMRLLHGMFDAGISAFNSGGFERASSAFLLCGLPTAVTEYFCGVDFTEQSFVTPIKWAPYYQEGTNFVKAANSPESIRDFMAKIYSASPAEKQRVSEEGRDWSVKMFSVETIGAQWEGIFDSIKPKDWSSIVLEYVKKNETYPMPQMQDNESWVRALYTNILLVEPDPKGLSDWMSSLENGATRDQIYKTFVDIAKSDNAKNGKQPMFKELFDANGRKRILYVLKESGGDIFIATGTFKGLKDLYPDADLYVATDPKFHEILAGNPYVHKVLAYAPVMEQELQMIPHVDYYYYPALPTQRQLAYLTKGKIGLDLTKGITT